MFTRISKKALVTAFVAGIAVGAAASTIARTIFFPDVPIDAYYRQSIDEASRLGLITGFGDGTFKPDDPLTRGQAAVIFMRFARLVGVEIPEEEPPPPPPALRASSAPSSARATATSRSSAASVAERQVNEKGLFRFTTGSYKVDEDEGTVLITVVRTSGNEGIVEVDYELSAGTSAEGDDYEALTGTLRFDDGETSASFEVTIVDDTEQEDSETVLVTLTNPTGGAGLSEPKVATITILDDDTGGGGQSTTKEGPDAGTFNYSATNYGVAENGGSITVRVERVKALGAVTVDYATSNGTAKSAEDYVSKGGTLSFGDGETSKSFALEIKDNGNIDGNREFNLSLTKPTGGAILGVNQKAEVTIHDDDTGASFGTGSFRFAKSSFEGSEDEGESIVSINRVGGTRGEVTVKYETTAGTATPARDYTEVSGTMTFREGEAGKTFVVPIEKDALSDSGETVNLQLQEPSGGAGLLSPSNASLTIY